MRAAAVALISFELETPGVECGKHHMIKYTGEERK